MIHLLVGPDRYLVDQHLAHLLATLDADGLNTTRFSSSTDLNEIASAVATVGFFGAGRVIVAEGVLTRASGAVKANKSADIQAIGNLTASIAPGNHLILVDAEIATVPKAITDAVSDLPQPMEGKPGRGSELIRWTQEVAKQQGATIDQSVARQLLARLFPEGWAKIGKSGFDKPPDLATLVSTLEKLSLYADGRPITPGEIDVLVTAETSDQKFAFADSIIARDIAKSLRLLVDQGLDDDSAAKLLAYVGTEAELALVMAAAGRSENLLGLSKELPGASPGRLERLQGSASSKGADSLGADVASADRRLKTGKVRGVQNQLYDVLISRANNERGR